MLAKVAGKRSARIALEDYWDGSFPVDPAAIAEVMGIEVRSTIFEDSKISGAIERTPATGTAIYFAENEPFERQIFTIAHELGHYFDREEARDSSYAFVERRGGPHTIHELYADEFAGNLLMPSTKFRELLNLGMDFRDIARFFGVSEPAARKRYERIRSEADSLTIA